MNVKILLKQHVGVPATPLVRVCDQVLRGECIATPSGLGAAVHSSVTGIVTAVSEEAIEISGEATGGFVPIPASSDYLELIKSAGIVGAGGAGFPTHVKLSISLKEGYVIANAAECEPVLSHNIALLEKDPHMVLKGLSYAKQITGAAHGWIAIKKKHLHAIRSLKQALVSYPDLELKYLPDMYPSGDERVIVRELLGFELQPGQLPSAANAVIQNVETLKRIAEAITLRKPFIDKDLSVGGRIQGDPCGKVYLDQPIGKMAQELIEEAGGYKMPHGEIVLGGPFTGKHGQETDPVTKTLGGLLVAMPFPQETSKMGLLVCECGAGEERLREIAHQMGATVVAVEKCKRLVEVQGRDRCELPGVCPGQTEKILIMRKKGMQAILAGSCGD